MGMEGAYTASLPAALHSGSGSDTTSNSLFYPLINEDETLNLMSMKQYEQSD